MGTVADTLDLKLDVLSIPIGINDTDFVVRQQNIVTGEQYEQIYQAQQFLNSAIDYSRKNDLPLHHPYTRSPIFRRLSFEKYSDQKLFFEFQSKESREYLRCLYLTL